MARQPDSGHINFDDIFLKVQKQMLACLAVGEVFEHPTACGAASEQHWIDLFTDYLPPRYRASPAFVVDADGNRSRQIDIAIYDNLYSPLIFPHDSGIHIPAESVYAVFEVKQGLTRQLIHDAGSKAASVRALRRTSAPVISAGSRRPAIQPRRILAGILAVDSVWGDSFQTRIGGSINSLAENEKIDLGCALQQGSFERIGSRGFRFSDADETLIFFVIRLMERLRLMGTTPAVNLMEYAKSLKSLQKYPRAA